MRTAARSSLLLLALLLVLGAASSAQASYPPRSFLYDNDGWECSNRGESFLSSSVRFASRTNYEFTRDGRTGRGTYRYIRDSGKISFRSGILGNYLGKLRRTSYTINGFFIEVRHDSTKKVFVTCAQGWLGVT